MIIKESQLRKMIREVILELSTSVRAGGRSKISKGKESATTKSAKSAEDRARSQHKTSSDNVAAKKAKYDKTQTTMRGLSGKELRKPDPRAPRGTYIYSSRPGPGFLPNPDYSAADRADREAKTAYDNAVSDEASKKTDLKDKETARRKAEKKDIEDQNTAAEPTADEPGPPAAGAGKGRGGKGKGKGKGRGKGKGDDE